MSKLDLKALREERKPCMEEVAKEVAKDLADVTIPSASESSKRKRDEAKPKKKKKSETKKNKSTTSSEDPTIGHEIARSTTYLPAGAGLQG
jgi:ribosomal protein L12E/L44/L45/RPP1/RPP2